MRPIKTICLLLATLAMMTSCLSSNDSNTTLSSDAAITAFAIGDMKRTVNTKTAAGKDTTYTTTVTGTNYSFVIDQVAHRIYNPDSLPVGTNVSKVTVAISTYNDAPIFLKDTESDDLIIYNSSDSTNFTKTRTYVIYGADYKGTTEYKVDINVHKEDGTKFEWTLMDNDWLPESEEIELPDGIKQLIGNSTTEMYALSKDNRLMVSTDNGESWEEDLIDDDTALLPTEDIAMVCYPMESVILTDYVLMVGNRDIEQYPADVHAKVWRKIVDFGELAPVPFWAYIDRPENDIYQLPRMKDISLVVYDGSVLAFGAPYNKIYQSRDNGITWKENSTFKMPEDFDTDATKVVVTVDDDNFIWLYCIGTGQVWRGRLNRLGWK